MVSDFCICDRQQICDAKAILNRGVSLQESLDCLHTRVVPLVVDCSCRQTRQYDTRGLTVDLVMLARLDVAQHRIPQRGMVGCREKRLPVGSQFRKITCVGLAYLNLPPISFCPTFISPIDEVFL